MTEQLKVIISAEIDKLKKGMQDARKEISNFKKQYEKASKDVDKYMKQAGEGIKKGLKTASTAIAATGAALIGLGASTAEYRAEQAKLNAAFEAAGSTAKTAQKTYKDLYRVLGDGGQATEAANHLAKLTKEEKALNEWTKICQGVYAEFGVSLPLEGLTEAVNHTAKLGEVQGPLADALEWSGMTVDEFNAKLAECNTESEREALIRETLADIYNDSADIYEKTAAETLKQRDAQALLQEQTAKLGEVIAPLVTAFTEFGTKALSVVVPYIQQLGEKYMPVLQVALEAALEIMGNIFSFIDEYWPIILTVAGVIGGITAAIGLYNAVAAVKAAMAAAEVTTVWGLVTAYAAQAAAVVAACAPYVLIVAAIAAVIAIIVTCIKHWDDIKAAVKNTWQIVKEDTAKFVEQIKTSFNNFKSSIVNTVNNIKQSVLNVFDNIKTGIKTKIASLSSKRINTINRDLSKCFTIYLEYNRLSILLSR